MPYDLRSRAQTGEARGGGGGQEENHEPKGTGSKSKPTSKTKGQKVASTTATVPKRVTRAAIKKVSYLEELQDVPSPSSKDSQSKLKTPKANRLDQCSSNVKAKKLPSSSMFLAPTKRPPKAKQMGMSPVTTVSKSGSGRDVRSKNKYAGDLTPVSTACKTTMSTRTRASARLKAKQASEEVLRDSAAPTQTPTTNFEGFNEKLTDDLFETVAPAVVKKSKYKGAAWKLEEVAMKDLKINLEPCDDRTPSPKEGRQGQTVKEKAKKDFFEVEVEAQIFASQCRVTAKSIVTGLRPLKELIETLSVPKEDNGFFKEMRSRAEVVQLKIRAEQQVMQTPQKDKRNNAEPKEGLNQVENSDKPQVAITPIPEGLELTQDSRCSPPRKITQKHAEELHNSEQRCDANTTGQTNENTEVQELVLSVERMGELEAADVVTKKEEAVSGHPVKRPRSTDDIVEDARKPPRFLMDVPPTFNFQEIAQKQNPLLIQASKKLFLDSRSGSSEGKSLKRALPSPIPEEVKEKNKERINSLSTLNATLEMKSVSKDSEEGSTSSSSSSSNKGNRGAPVTAAALSSQMVTGCYEVPDLKSVLEKDEKASIASLSKDIGQNSLRKTAKSEDRKLPSTSMSKSASSMSLSKSASSQSLVPSKYVAPKTTSTANLKQDDARAKPKFDFKTNLLEREEEAKRKKAQFLQERQEIQRKKNEEWKKKAEKIKMQEENKRLVTGLKPKMVGNKSLKPTKLFPSTPQSKNLLEPMSLKHCGPILKSPNPAMPMPVAEPSQAVIASSSQMSIHEEEEACAGGNGSTFEATGESTFSSYNITHYEDFDEGMEHREGKEIPDWAKDKQGMSAALFTQVLHRDHPRLHFIFPDVVQGYQIFPSTT